MNRPLRARLTGRAAQFVSLLQDYGHLDDQAADRLYVAVADLVGSDREQLVDLPTIRRLAAAVLFDLSEDDGRNASLIRDDWPLLFH